ncbi:MAG: hypothetical protein ACI96P_001195 [Candidatus Azotimanducaceae bacterium]|jgi:hypothetical protein
MNVSMKIPPITPAIGAERTASAAADAKPAPSATAGASGNSQAAAGNSLLAQVTTAQSATDAAEVRLLRTGETLLLASKPPLESKAALQSSVALQIGQIVSVKAVAGGYQLDQSGPSINQYLLRLLLPRDATLQRPIAEMQRWQATTFDAPPTPGTRAITTQRSTPGISLNNLSATPTNSPAAALPNTPGAAIISRLRADLVDSPGAALIKNPRAAQPQNPPAALIKSPSEALIKNPSEAPKNRPAGALTNSPAINSLKTSPQALSDLSAGRIRLAGNTTQTLTNQTDVTVANPRNTQNASQDRHGTNSTVPTTISTTGLTNNTATPATMRDTTAAAQRLPVPEATVALVRSLINNIPQRGQLDAKAIREFVSQASLLPASRDLNLSQPTADERSTSAASTTVAPGTAARPGLVTLLLQIARSLAPGDALPAGAVSSDRPTSGTHLRKPVADMLGKLLINQLQPLMQRLETADSEMRRVDLLVRNDPQLDNFNLQFSRVDLPTTRVKEDAPDAGDHAAAEKTRAWRVKLTFHLQRLGEVSAIVNYTEGQTLSTSIWSDNVGTFALMRKHQSQLQERLATSLQDSGIEIQVDVHQGKPSDTTSHLSSHLVDTRA